MRPTEWDIMGAHPTDDRQQHASKGSSCNRRTARASRSRTTPSRLLTTDRRPAPVADPTQAIPQYGSSPYGAQPTQAFGAPGYGQQPAAPSYDPQQTQAYGAPAAPGAPAYQPPSYEQPSYGQQPTQYLPPAPPAPAAPPASPYGQPQYGQQPYQPPQAQQPYQAQQYQAPAAPAYGGQYAAPGGPGYPQQGGFGQPPAPAAKKKSRTGLFVILGVLAVVVIAAVIGVVLANGPLKKTVLDHTSVEATIERQAKQNDISISNVSCPSGEEVKANKTFTCSATGGTVEVTITSSSGDWEWTVKSS
jgi:hypothetical protein